MLILRPSPFWWHQYLLGVSPSLLLLLCAFYHRYYLNEESASSSTSKIQVLAAIDLCLMNISAVEDKAFILSVASGASQKDIVLKAPSHTQALEWVATLRELKGKYQSPSQPPKKTDVSEEPQDDAPLQVTLLFSMTKPLGLDLGHVLLDVKGCATGSQAEELGVSRGWRVVAVNQSPIVTLDAMQDILEAALDDESSSIEVVFELPATTSSPTAISETTSISVPSSKLGEPEAETPPPVPASVPPWVEPPVAPATTPPVSGTAATVDKFRTSF